MEGLLLSQEILNGLYKYGNNYEIRNIWERFMLELGNKGSLYSKITINSPVVKKLINELNEKKYEVDMVYIKDFINKINTFVKKKEAQKYDIELVYTNDTIIISSNNNIFKVKPYTINVLKDYSDDIVIPMVVRYLTSSTGSLQWAVPKIQYDYLYDNYNVRYEGFASPLNSRLMGRPNAKFCSLYYDTDKHFGSMGSFFGKKMRKGNWAVNPPYIETIMENAAKKCVKEVNSMIFFTMPYWTDCNAYKILMKHAKYFKLLERYKHFYESNIRIISKFDSIVFILDSYKKDIDYTGICDKMII